MTSPPPTGPAHRAPDTTADSTSTSTSALTSAGPASTPAAEIEIDEDLVRRLLAEQHPDLGGRPLTPLASGWDNVMFRLGPDLVVRLPRRLAAAELVEHEQRWLAELAPTLPLPVPAPVRLGRPTAFYPWSWSVLPWFDGGPAGTDPSLDGPTVAHQLGRFLAALHRPAPADAPANPHRGVPLREREARFLTWVDALADSTGRPGLLDRETTLARWTACVAAPVWDGPPQWVHGDLHGHNLLSQGGELSAVIDFGDITAGDPATDLAVAWSVLDPADWPAFRAAATTEHRPIDEAMWLRAEGNALAVGVAILANSADNPAMAAMARRTLGPLVIEGNRDTDGE